jgi:hypothetical protein
VTTHVKAISRRSTAVALLASLLLAGAITVTNADGRHDTTSTVETGLYRNHTAAYWAQRFRHRTRQLQAARAFLQRRWRPTVTYALRLASAVSGVSYWELRAVSWCESHHYPFASNGRYRGLFQEGPMFEAHPIGRAGFSVFDPLANSLVAALTVRQQGWRQWECR